MGSKKRRTKPKRRKRRRRKCEKGEATFFVIESIYSAASTFVYAFLPFTVDIMWRVVEGARGNTMNQPTNGIYKPPRRRKISKVGIGCSHLISILRTGATGNPITSPIDQATVDDARKNANKFQMKFVKCKRGENTNKVKKKQKKTKMKRCAAFSSRWNILGKKYLRKEGRERRS